MLTFKDRQLCVSQRSVKDVSAFGQYYHSKYSSCHTLAKLHIVTTSNVMSVGCPALKCYLEPYEHFQLSQIVQTTDKSRASLLDSVCVYTTLRVTDVLLN